MKRLKLAILTPTLILLAACGTNTDQVAPSHETLPKAPDAALLQPETEGSFAPLHSNEYGTPRSPDEILADVEALPDDATMYERCSTLVGRGCTVIDMEQFMSMRQGMAAATAPGISGHYDTQADMSGHTSCLDGYIDSATYCEPLYERYGR